MQFAKVVAIALIPILMALNGYTEEDVNILADVMWLENGHTGKNEEENRQVLILTGAVVMNRTKSDSTDYHPKGKNSIRDVVYHKGQYCSKTRNGVGNTNTPDYVRDLAKELLAYGSNVPEYVLYQSQNSRLGTIWKKIAGEYFATERGHKDEGYDFVAKTNLDLCIDRWDALNDFRNAYN